MIVSVGINVSHVIAFDVLRGDDSPNFVYRITQEKCDRTIELCLKFDEKARIAEYQYFRSDEAEEAEQAGVDIELAALDAKLRGGGDMFHRLCAILSFACIGSTRSHGHVRDQLKLQGSGISGEWNLSCGLYSCCSRTNVALHAASFFIGSDQRRVEGV